MKLRSVLISMTVPAMLACVQEPSASARLSEDGDTPRAERRAHAADLPRESVSSGEASSTDFSAFVPESAKVVDVVHGDLTGRGSADVLLVIAPDVGAHEGLGEGPARSVILLTRDASGELRKSAENARIVPCARCGGVAGDPYGYARIEAGTVTVSISGGSRERWFDDYIFRYSATASSWRLFRVVRGVTDTQTGAQKQVELSEEDFGDVAFAEFEPAALSAVSLD